jgi:hypothetical protein
MTQQRSPYADWKAPGEDSGILIWPQPDALLEHTQLNFNALSNAKVLIGGVELRELRRRQREWLKLDDASPIIGMGHQTELYHSGVWAKLALMDAAGRRSGAKTFHLAVDTDAPKHLNLRWPGVSLPITDDPRLYAVHWSGLVNGPSAGHVGELKSALGAAGGEWPFVPMAMEFLDALQQNAGEQTSPLARGILEATGRLDKSLGLGQRAAILSPMLESEPYLVLVHHLLARAGEFGHIYNGALAGYRVRHRLRTAAKPMPDLRVSADECESPFWLDCLKDGSRSRATVERTPGGWALKVEGDQFVFEARAEGWAAAARLREFLRRNELRISPRALTLTLFVRLLVMDQFVHGIGGGRYDQVTDQVMAKFIGIEPPAFAVTTATLLFPTAVGRLRPCLPCLAHEGHRLRHGLLGERKMEWVRQIESLPRRSHERQRVFAQMHGELSTALHTHAGVGQWEERVAEANRQMADELPLFDRELFYAMQPRERLETLIGKYREQFQI